MNGPDGAKSLLLRIGRIRKKWDDYGDVLGVFVWEEGAAHGQVFRLKPGLVGEVEAARVSAIDLHRLEAQRACTATDIASFF